MMAFEATPPLAITVMGTTYIQLNSADPSVLDHSTPGDFTVQLGRAHTFGGEYEVFLSEAVIPFTWQNVTQTNNSLVIKEGKTSKRVALPPAYYESIPTLVKAINDGRKAASLSTITFTVHKLTMKVTVNAEKAIMQGAILRLLGWPEGAVVAAPRMGDITGGANSLFVLVDCVALTTAGSFSIPLLKKGVGRSRVGRDDRPGDLMHYRAFDPVEVHKLNQNTLMHIAVTIKNAQNKVVDFNGFHVDLTLGFRAMRR